MVEHVIVPIVNPDHAVTIGEYFALSTAVKRLEKQAEWAKLPGFALALSLVQTLEAEQRARMTERNMRAVIAAGHDLTTLKLVSLRGPNLVLEPMDLADLAELNP
jgi:hypothetical protein